MYIILFPCNVLASIHIISPHDVPCSHLTLEFPPEVKRMCVSFSFSKSLSVSLLVKRIINKGKLGLVSLVKKSLLAVCSCCFTSYSHLPDFITMPLYCPDAISSALAVTVSALLRTQKRSPYT